MEAPTQYVALNCSSEDLRRIMKRLKIGIDWLHNFRSVTIKSRARKLRTLNVDLLLNLISILQY